VLNDAEVIHIRGVEVAWSQNFDQWLPIKGVGVTSNVTIVDPDNTTLGNGFHLRNLSKLTWNLTPYWENEKYSIRVSLNHRSGYDQDYADSFFAGYGETHTVKARTQVDLALGYTMNKHLSFTAGVINLNNSHEDAYYQNASTFQMASRTGRNVYFSATGKF
jgi:TonB-dependent receptor